MDGPHVANVRAVPEIDVKQPTDSHIACDADSSMGRGMMVVKRWCREGFDGNVPCRRCIDNDKQNKDGSCRLRAEGRGLYIFTINHPGETGA